MTPPHERIVLGFGVVLAAVAYVYWMVVGMQRGESWQGTAALRAAFVLGGTFLLALVLRLAFFLNRRP